MTSVSETTSLMTTLKRCSPQSTRDFLCFTASRSSSSSSFKNIIPEKSSLIFETGLLQAIVFLEDAINYRSIDHKDDIATLKLYRKYYSRYVQWCLKVVIILLHLIVFLEWPSSWTESSDHRYLEDRPNLTCGITESTEIIFLSFLAFDIFIKGRLFGISWLLRSPWMIVCSVAIIISYIDVVTSLAMECSEPLRIRRFLRPIFLLQSSEIIKKSLVCICSAFKEIIGLLILMCCHVYFFILLGMLLFSGHPMRKNRTHSEKFDTMEGALMNLILLLTTANNPDVMMPVYKQNRLTSLYFIGFLFIGVLFFMNMLTAAVYNRFRGYFVDSVAHSIHQKHLSLSRMFSVLQYIDMQWRGRYCIISCANCVSVKSVQEVIQYAKMKPAMKHVLLKALSEFPDEFMSFSSYEAFFDLLEKDHHPVKIHEPRVFTSSLYKVMQRIVSSPYLAYVDIIIIIIDLALCGFLWNDLKSSTPSSYTFIFEVGFCICTIYFILQFSFKAIFLGFSEYYSSYCTIFDTVVILVLMILQCIYFTFNNPNLFNPNPDILPADTVIGICNILVLLRMMSILMEFEIPYLVSVTLLTVMKNLQPFLAILGVAFYIYSLLGMQLFGGKITYPQGSNRTVTWPCGSYQELDYWANNFDDFASSLLVLWNVMIMNNWQVFLHAYTEATGTSWCYVYFTSWLLVSVLICLNLFTALVMENFVMKWNHVKLRRSRTSESHLTASYEETLNMSTMQDIFKHCIGKENVEDSFHTLNINRHH